MRVAAKKREVVLPQEILEELRKRGIGRIEKTSVRVVDGKPYLVVESGGRSVRVELEERNGVLVGVRVVD